MQLKISNHAIDKINSWVHTNLFIDHVLTYEVAAVEQIPVEFATMLTFSFFNLVMDHTMNWIIIQTLNPYILANSSVFLVLAALVPKLVV